jgi:hypothetical protein
LSEKIVYQDKATGGLSSGSASLIRSNLAEIARVLVRFNHVARFIVNANHNIM